MIGVIVVLLAEAHEWAEAHWFYERERPFCFITCAEEDFPKVSIHVPCYNEPPELMIATLNALAAMDYPRFEVIVIDNNTKDPACGSRWGRCAKLGGVRAHVDPLAGFRQGPRRPAPYGQRRSCDRRDRWMATGCGSVPHPTIPTWGSQRWATGCKKRLQVHVLLQYRGFFYIGMITCDERAIVALVPDDGAQISAGGGQRLASDHHRDAELGLRIREGYHAVYVLSYGRG
jgi:cellulose synthase/poly-beta-1,6-N-acetylglucosamine synthase-like glycosyltransferase